MNSNDKRLMRSALYVIGPLVAVVLLFVLLSVMGGYAGTGSATATGKDNYVYGTRDLKGATPAQVGQFAVQYALAQGAVRSGKPQVLLSRSVKRSDVSALGIACMGGSSTIEEPPLVLVIMKGDFRLKGGGGSSHALVAPYLAYVFDVWAAEPMLTSASTDGAKFRQALNDPSLPANPDGVLSCPTDVPSTQTLHYGDFPPTPSVVPVTEPPSQVPSSPIPSPVPTSLP